MNGIYEVYKLNSAGVRDSLIDRYSALEGELNWSKNSSFTISGTCSGSVPVSLTDRIVITRNGMQIFTGIVTELLTDCADVENNIKTWQAIVSGDAIVLNWRYVFATGNNTAPANIEIAEDVYDKLPNNEDETSTRSALDRMLYYIRKHIGPNAAADRQLVTVSEADDDTRGDQGRSAYHIKQLSDVLSEIGDDSGLYCKVITNSSGARVLTIPDPRDRTEQLIISPEFGNVAEWRKEEAYPEFNAVWMLSGITSQKNEDETTTQTRVWVYAEDEDSIAKYGRIEKVVTKSDIKVVYEDPEKEDIVPVTEEEVRKLLEDEASRQLKENAATLKWTVTMMETNACAFMDDWILGDRVRCVIDGEYFDSLIETVSISYSAGIETVTPTIGEVETGLYGKLFKTLNGIDSRLKAKEEN